MGNFINKAIDANPIYKYGGAVYNVSLPNGNYNSYHETDGESDISYIDIALSGRFDDPRYYSGDTAN